MTTHHTAQGLASLGRHGDTMLVHMSPHEVAGLNYLAKKQGTKLTVNPDTGLPEAFSLGGLFSSILPMFAGAMFPGAGFAMEPLLAGAVTGGALAAAKGENPLMGGLMGGLGGISGSNLAQGLTGAAGGLSGAVPSAGGYVPGTVEGANTALNVPGASMMNNPAITNAQNLVAQSGAGAGSAASGASAFNPMDTLSKATQGAGNLISGKPGAWEGFKNAYGATPLTNTQAALKIGMPVGGAILGGLEPSDLYGEPMKPKTDKYDPYATLRLDNDTGLRLVAKGGYIDGYAMGGTVTTGGLRDLYATTDSPSNPQLSRDGYGVGRLENLARQQALTQAQTMGYAMGGPVSFADGGDTNPLNKEIPPVDESMGITALTPTTPNVPGQMMPTEAVQNAASALSNTASSDSSIIAQVANNLRTDPNYQPKNPIEAAIAKQIKGTDQAQQSQGLGSLGAQPAQAMAPTYAASQPIGPTYYAGMNAPRGFADGGDVAPSDATPGSEASARDAYMSDVQRALMGSSPMHYTGATSGPAFASSTPYGTDMIGEMMRVSPEVFRYSGYGVGRGTSPEAYAAYTAPSFRRGFADGGDVASGDLSADSAADLAAFQAAQANNPSGLYGVNSGGYGITAPTRPTTTPSYMLSPEMQRSIAMRDAERERLAAYLAPSFRRGMAQGGYLDGQGDGMSDSIPATIEGKQPARLADGEFVVPADVVSHIGNGSSKAGSKRLYSMLDRVRKARTGHTKQGKEIKPEKYMPA